MAKLGTSLVTRSWFRHCCLLRTTATGGAERRSWPACHRLGLKVISPPCLFPFDQRRDSGHGKGETYRRNVSACLPLGYKACRRKDRHDAIFPGQGISRGSRGQGMMNRHGAFGGRDPGLKIGFRPEIAELDKVRNYPPGISGQRQSRYTPGLGSRGQSPRQGIPAPD